MSRLVKNVTRFHPGRMHALDVEENKSRWKKRDTFWRNPNSVSCYTSENVSRFTKNVTRFRRIFVPI